MVAQKVFFQLFLDVAYLPTNSVQDQYRHPRIRDMMIHGVRLPCFMAGTIEQKISNEVLIVDPANAKH